MVQQLGARDAGYGVKKEDYGTVGEALLWTLEQGLGDAFTPSVKEAWTVVYTLLSETMINAAKSQEDKMLQEVDTYTGYNQFNQMVDDMPINVIMCDLSDFTITYVNKSSVETLRPLQHLLNCKVDDMVGQCIDIFHKDPSMQRPLEGVESGRAGARFVLTRDPGENLDFAGADAAPQTG